MTYYEKEHKLTVGSHVMYTGKSTDYGVTGIVTDIQYGNILKVVSDEGQKFISGNAKNDNGVNYRYGRYVSWKLI